jgi:hypothetical protein
MHDVYIILDRILEILYLKLEFKREFYKWPLCGIHSFKLVYLLCVDDMLRH